MLTTGVDPSAGLMGFDAMSVIGRVCVFSGYSFLGFAMKRLDLFSKKDGLVMLKFVVNVTLPALLLHTLSTSASMYVPHVNNVMVNNIL